MRNSRIDRIQQMSKQEEIILKKRQEILEKQRTAQLAKAVAAAQSLAAKQKGDDVGVLAPNETSKETNNQIDTLTTTPTVAEGGAAYVQAEKEEKKEIIVKKDDPETIKMDTITKTANSLTCKTGKISFGIKRSQLAAPMVEQPAPKAQNSFCNDGSFLDHFKKILEKHDQPKPTPPVLMPETLCDTTGNIGTPPIDLQTQPTDQHDDEQDQHEQILQNTQLQLPQMPQMQQTQQLHPQQNLPPPPPLQPSGLQFAFNPNLLTQSMMMAQQQHQHPHPSLLSQSQLQQQQQQQQRLNAAFFTNSPPRLVHSVPNVIAPPPPPPPPPQIPMALANLAPLYMIPAPEPLKLNAIPAPKDFNLNAIPKPQINLEVIKVPNNEQLQMQQQLQPQQQQSQNQTQQEQQQLHPQKQLQHEDQQREQVFSDLNDHKCKHLPTTLANLLTMVAENGDEFEDKLRTRKNELHPAMWFLFDKNCEQYHKYRQELNERCNQQNQQEQHQQQEESSPNHVQNISINYNSFDATTSLAAARACAPSPDGEKYDPESVIDSGDVDSDDEYMRGMLDRNRDNLKRRIECRNELSEEERQEREAEAEQEERRRQEKKKLRKSRWGEKVTDMLKDDSSSSGMPTTFGNQNKPMLTAVTRTDPALLQYARLNYGSITLSEDDWQKCEEHYKVNLLYQDMMKKRQEIDRLARNGKFKYEYDSDEDVDGGTWEHKLRCAEMDATQAWANALTKQSEGKHHIGDFLPPEELKKFMEQYEAKKSNRLPDLSDYKEYKLKEDNIGFQMLQKLGWKQGQGLGTDGAGIVDPVNKCPQREGNQGLGVSSSATPENCDNEYDAYRKRMMLAYRFRPNPLNNPRRAYY